MLELLAPAGSPEAVAAAVQNGANAIYLGYDDLNARRNAKNFSPEEVAAAVSYCHLRGVKVYLTLNTLVTDREMARAAAVAARAAQAGVDAVLVQDLGVLRMLRQSVPDLAVHASTQMTVHNLEGVLACAALGMRRVVLARELTREEIAFICAHSPIEIEVFAHGALCMSYSGQCFLSSVIGGRSGNRGMCAQPCRLPYRLSGRAEERYPLSLKDLSLAGHLRELREMGVACVKLEGRMKRPEYVAVVTKIYADAIREGREPTPRECSQLEQAFSRQGFTQGYFEGEKGPDMFGIREDTEEPADLFAQAKAGYEKEQQLIPVTFYALIRQGEPVLVGVKDPEDRVATQEGPVPEAALTKELTAEDVKGQLHKTGGTPYLCQTVQAMVEPGLSVPVSALNQLRRQVLEQLSLQRIEHTAPTVNEFSPGARYEVPQKKPVLTVSLRKFSQLTKELLQREPDVVYLPTDEIDQHRDALRSFLQKFPKTEFCAALPRVCWDHEMPRLERELTVAWNLGFRTALVGNLGLGEVARKLGFALRGDFGLGVTNTQTVKELKRLGYQSAAASFELKLAQVRDLEKALDLELIVYGRLPLMLTENCVIRCQTGLCKCDAANSLEDRKGMRFPLLKAWGCRNELFNSKKLFLADKPDYEKIGLWGARLLFTTENPRECVTVLERYRKLNAFEPADLTRGLYYRSVE